MTAEITTRAPFVLAEIESAFRNSGLDCDFDNPAMRWAINALGCQFLMPPSSASARPRKIGSKAARKELDELAKLAEMLTKRVGTLSATAIGALGGPHIMIASARQLDWLRDLAAVARAADAKGGAETIKQGRPKNRRAIYAAEIIINAFEAITLCKVDRPNSLANMEKPRLLEPLVRKLFEVLDIRGNAKAAINSALVERMKRAHQNSTREEVHAPRITSEEFWDRMRVTDLAERSPRFWKHKNTRPNED